MHNMSETYNFDDIRPFRDSEVEKVINELCQVPYFIGLLGRLFPGVPMSDIMGRLHALKSIDEFQRDFIIPYLNGLIKTTTDGVSSTGAEKLPTDGAYLFLSNHRDIILDSAFMNVKLNELGHSTTEIGIGSNLLIYDWIVDLVKLNKSFVVKRDLPVRQMMEASGTLSAYIRNSITVRHQNIWLAQREGRSKDGNDQTQSSVLKMLNLSGTKRLEENFGELNIVPVSIAYEYDPCDYLKAYQAQLKRDNPEYHKSKQEDLQHMNYGLNGYKGRIRFTFGEPLDVRGLEGKNRNAQIDDLANRLDKTIHKNYHLWPSNYVAYDELRKSRDFAKEYTQAERQKFLDNIDSHIALLTNVDVEFVRTTILKMYANPVINKLAVCD